MKANNGILITHNIKEFSRVEGLKIEKENELNKLSLEEHYNFYKNNGLEKKEIIKKIAKDRGVNKNEIYQHFV